MISFNDFKELDLLVGEITSASEVEEADSLLHLTVEVGEEEPRSIVAGIKSRVEDMEALAGKKVVILANLEPKEMFGIESQGMMLVATDDENFSLLGPHTDVPVGTSIS